jgi:hypothetical protein
LTRVGAITTIGPALARELLVADRDYLLLELRAATLGPLAWINLSCPLPACGEPMELKVDLGELPFERRRVSQTWFETDGAPAFRLPTGADQEVVARLYAADPEGAAATLRARCLAGEGARGTPDGTAPIGGAAALEERMAAIAPSLDIEMDALCPSCGGGFETPLPLVPSLLADLHLPPHSLEQEIHLLAWHYHWSEQEILALPRRKRRRYVNLVRQELDAWCGQPGGWQA